jgi:serine/threonine-protein kinase RsbW
VSSLTDRPAKKVFNIDIPSELGFEKIPIAAVAIVAKKMGFDPEQVEKLKTVMGEAVTNAIEHGNLLSLEARVQIVLTVESDSLVMSVVDEGKQPIPVTPPPRKGNRGWGLSWIQEFSDEVNVAAAPGRNEIKMIAYLHKEA